MRQLRWFGLGLLICLNVLLAHQPVRATTAGITLTVNAAAPQHPISPLIYGVQYITDAFATEIALPLRRWGGNNSSRYNWTVGTHGATNLASDWYFENATYHDWIAGSDLSADAWIDRNETVGAASLLTIPMIGYVAKDLSACGFNVATYGAQQGSDPWRPDCGNGRLPGGGFVTGNNPLDTSIAVDATFTTNWLNHLIATHGAAGTGGVQFYNLDNEPEIWHETHRDVHPAPLDYDELVSKTIAHAAAIKASDPAAQTLGYASFGWSGYWYSPADLAWRAANGWAWPSPDYAAHNNRYLVEHYLAELQAYEVQHGTRLLDYLDFHYYPQNGVALTTAGDAARQQRRMNATRSLWDPTWQDESWIADAGPDGGRIQLIPRMQTWIDSYYPGTAIAISEYNFGGLEHVNGAVAQADVLGIFAREGVDLAVLFPDFNQDISPLPVGHALRLFRNYDGNGGQFGDTYVESLSSDQTTLAVYGALHGADGELTVLVVNKSFAAQTGDLNLGGISLPATAQVYRYGAADLSAIARLADVAIGAGPHTATYPAQSLTLYVVRSDPAVPTTVGLLGQHTLVPAGGLLAVAGLLLGLALLHSRRRSML